MTKLRIVCAVATLAATASGTALADASANFGITSDYVFRGLYQSDASAFAGLDIEADSGFYLGTWGIDVGQGLEYDVYLGYAGGGEELQWYAGFTGYYYTDEFDDTYEEFNVGFSFGFLSIDYALGDFTGPVFDVFGNQVNLSPQGSLQEQTYEYVGATFTPETGPYYFIGRTDFHNVTGTGAGGRDGYWVEIGKSFEIMEDLEFDVRAIYSGDVPQGTSTSPASVAPSASMGSEYAVIVTLTKTLSIGD
jgi:hypothetical protein